MKNSTQSIALVLLATASGVTLFALASTSVTALVRGDVVAAAAVSLGIVSLAFHDYSRRSQPLRQPGRILRPALPVAIAAPSNHRPLPNSFGKHRVAA